MDRVTFNNGPKDDRDVPSCCYLDTTGPGRCVRTTSNCSIGQEYYSSALDVTRPGTAVVTGTTLGARLSTTDEDTVKGVQKKGGRNDTRKEMRI